MQGYIKDDHDQSCIDFDECEQGTHTCHAESQVLILNKWLPPVRLHHQGRQGAVSCIVFILFKN